MPELPEVERARALIEARALGREIAGVDDSDAYVCRPHAPGELRGAFVGTRLTAAHRQGKSLWCQTDRGPALGLHLGMAGRIVVDDAQAGDPNPDPRGALPVWDRFTLTFADGGHLILRDKRRLGRAVIDPDLSHLGPDAADISRDDFRRRVGSGATPLKARLLDQTALAGVGNLLADQALWRSRLSPVRLTSTLDATQLDALRRDLRTEIRAAIRKGGVHTGNFVQARGRDGACPRCHALLGRAAVGGRTTYWCPHCQA